MPPLILFFGFTKDIPFTQGYQLKAQFESANSIRPNSPVRIAGVEVGKVKTIEPVEGTNAALLTMEINDAALPIHEDATAKIRPRIFLEGNFFVDLKPGTPDARGARLGRHDQDHPDGHAGAARPGADVAAERLARGPDGAAGRARRPR